MSVFYYKNHITTILRENCRHGKQIPQERIKERTYEGHAMNHFSFCKQKLEFYLFELPLSVCQ